MLRGMTSNLWPVLVGTSEIIRPLTKSTEAKSCASSVPLRKAEWLAGQIDGDGCFLISKKGYTSCEITMEQADEKAQAVVKDQIGGYIRLRSGSKSLRWRLHNKQGMISLINQVNGQIRNPTRFAQLIKVSQILNLRPIQASSLTINNSWFAGFFDADGTITFSFKINRPQLTIAVGQKTSEIQENFKLVFGGNIYFDKSYNGYSWSIQSRQEISAFLEYIKLHPLYSHKINRFYLVPEYYSLTDSKAYEQDKSSTNFIVWTNFVEHWNSKL